MDTTDPQLQAALRRNDYAAILRLVEPGSRVLDLGCGGGQLLQLLRDRKNITGYGVDLSPDLILECIGKGLSVFQGNLDEGLRDFEDQSFDYVILNQTLPVVHRPAFVIEEMLRVGRRALSVSPI
ncbi:MAG: methionine biosynthesis protein MetW, partial [Lentisphaeria bacterium]